MTTKKYKSTSHENKTTLNRGFDLLNETRLCTSPQAIPFQAVARTAEGNLISDYAISLRFSIHNSSPTGTIVYQETQNVTTNALGLFTVNVGQGNVVSGIFSAINWAVSSKFIQVELDSTGGSNFIDMGTQQMLSVPYAFYSDTSGVSRSDSWGAQSVVTNGTLSGNGTSGNALRIAQQSAISGNVLKWNGSTWLPAADDNSGGTVTSVIAGAGLSGGTITTTGTISLPNVGIAGMFGSATQVPVITTDTKGRVSGVSLNTITETDPQVGTVTLNKIPKWNGTALSDGILYDNGSSVGVGNTSPGAKLDISGSIKIADGTQGAGKVLTSNASGLASWQTTSSAAWSLTGNSGTNAGNFLGTIDQQPLRFRVDSAIAGLVDYDFPRNTSLGFQTLNSIQTFAVDNVAVGYTALRNNTTGALNTAIGSYALSSNTTGNYNTATGTYALNAVTWGGANTATGYFALGADTSGGYNTALGYSTLQHNLSGDRNTATGMGALFENTTGYDNTATGSNAAGKNTTGFYNTAIGAFSMLQNTTGTDNTAVGYNSLYTNNAGIKNSAVGERALRLNSSGNNNTALGYDALSSNTGGSENTAVGYNANISGGGGITNATAIGANAIVSASDALVLGNNANVGIRTSAPKSALEVVGALAVAVKTAQIAGTNHPDNTGEIWFYSSGAGTISFPAAISCSNRMYVIINQTGAACTTSSYRDITGTAVTSIPNNTSLWIVADGSLWKQIK